ncbi:MAG: arylamine N-acetyltransferase [Nitrospiraceae bacterium]
MDTLLGLHRAHVLTVPFENLNIHLGQPVSLDPDDLFRKIVHRRRGGYCFELNGLFALLLEDLGFSVTRLAARVLYGAVGDRPRSHQVLVVKMEGQVWLVDVGFGGNGLLEPFPVKVGERKFHGSDQFALSLDDRGEYLLQCEIRRAWEKLYSFTFDPCLPVDYTFANYYHSHSPDSLFTQRRICTMPTPDGRKTFTDMVLKIRTGGKTQEIHPRDMSEYRELLKYHFKLEVEGDFRSLPSQELHDRNAAHVEDE